MVLSAGLNLDMSSSSLMILMLGSSASSMLKNSIILLWSMVILVGVNGEEQQLSIVLLRHLHLAGILIIIDVQEQQAVGLDLSIYNLSIAHYISIVRN
jgi:hypothetical protein